MLVSAPIIGHIKSKNVSIDWLQGKPYRELLCFLDLVQDGLNMAVVAFLMQLGTKLFCLIPGTRNYIHTLKNMIVTFIISVKDRHV